MTEPSTRDELMALLRYANKSAIARELDVEPQSVINWANGKYPSDKRLAAVRRLFGLETQRTAAPSLTRRLLAGVMALETKVGISPDELAAAEESAAVLESALEADARLAGELERSPHKSDGPVAGRGGAQAGGSPGSKKRRPK